MQRHVKLCFYKFSYPRKTGKNHTRNAVNSRFFTDPENGKQILTQKFLEDPFRYRRHVLTGVH